MFGSFVFITSLPGPNHAGVAQLAEQLTCNQQVGGSIPLASSNDYFAAISCGVLILKDAKKVDKKVLTTRI